ncbi:MAG: DUF1285 domain-containing protein [Rhodospirillaceae bacterium]
MERSVLAGLMKTAPEISEGQQFCGDIDMRIRRDGTWLYHGSPIGRKQMVKLFSSVLKRDSNGEYWLETPAEKCRIQVEDVPFIALSMDVSGKGREQILEFKTNIDEIVVASVRSPIRVETDLITNEPSPYIMVRDGLEALISRAVFYDLVELGITEVIEGQDLFGVWSSGVFFELGNLDGYD